MAIQEDAKISIPAIPSATIRNLLIGLLAVIAVAVTSYGSWHSWRSAVDFPQYYVAARLYVEQRAPLIYDEGALADLEHRYFPQMPRHHLYFLDLPVDPAPMWYPPYAVPLLAWLSVFPAQAAMYTWTLLGLAAFIGSLVLLRRMFKLTCAQMIVTASVLAISGPFAQAIILGQPTFFILLMICVLVWAIRNDRPAIAACMLALLAIKPQLLLPLVIFFLGARRFKIVFAGMAIGALLVALSAATEGIATFTNYLTLARYGAHHPLAMGIHDCLTLRSQLIRLLPEAWGPVDAVSSIIYLIALAAIFVLGSRVAKSERWLETGLMVAFPLGCITALYFHPYDVLTMLPGAVVFATATFSHRLPRERELLAALYILLFNFVVYTTIYFWKFAINPHVFVLALFVAIAIRDFWKNDWRAAA